MSELFYRNNSYSWKVKDVEVIAEVEALEEVEVSIKVVTLLTL